MSSLIPQFYEARFRVEEEKDNDTDILTDGIESVDFSSLLLSWWVEYITSDNLVNVM